MTTREPSSARSTFRRQYGCPAGRVCSPPPHKFERFRHQRHPGQIEAAERFMAGYIPRSRQPPRWVDRCRAAAGCGHATCLAAFVFRLRRRDNRTTDEQQRRLPFDRSQMARAGAACDAATGRSWPLQPIRIMASARPMHPNSATGRQPGAIGDLTTFAHDEGKRGADGDGIWGMCGPSVAVASR
jgi:hypothetical protein